MFLPRTRMQGEREREGGGIQAKYAPGCRRTACRTGRSRARGLRDSDPTLPTPARDATTWKRDAQESGDKRLGSGRKDRTNMYCRIWYRYVATDTAVTYGTTDTRQRSGFLRKPARAERDTVGLTYRASKVSQTGKRKMEKLLPHPQDTRK